MRRCLLSPVLRIGLLLATLAAAPASAIDSLFVYQGRLADQGTPAQGICDFTMTQQDAAGNPVALPLPFDDLRRA
jgi:hypothetical protein